MTEKEEKASDKILKEIANLKTEFEAWKTSHKPPEEPKKEGHETLEEMLDCPNCYPKVKAAVVKKEGFKTPPGKRDRHEYPLMCKECGLRGKKEEGKCPNCGSTIYY